jgi:protease secretion system outer membrane protein
MTMHRKLIFRSMAGLLAGACALRGAAAMDLVEVYEAALKHDPVYRAAFYSNESGKENRVLGRAQLLPQVSASYSGGKSHSDITTGGAGTRREDYNTKSAVLQVRQPLFSLEALAHYREGGLQADYSEAIFLNEQQQVALRAVSAYVEVLFKLDQLAFAQAERDTYAERMKVNDRTFEKGEGTRTDMLETRARLDVAEAALLEAKDALATTRQALAGVIGGDPGELAPLAAEFRRPVAAELGFEDWKKVALERNPELRSKMLGVAISQQEINKARAGHTPRVDFVASYSKSKSDSINTIDQDYTTRSVGFQVNIPLYAGGSVSASTRQAVAAREKARADLDAATDKAVQELRRTYDTLVSSVSKIEALSKAVQSGELLLTATEQSIKGGVRINLDLLEAQRQLSVTRRDLAQARYTYIMTYLQLRAAAGTLSSADVREMGTYFR